MMKKVKALCLILLCCIGPMVLPLSAVAESIIILHTNDVHTSVDKNIGYAGVAYYKKRMQAKHGAQNVLMVDAGDAVQGGPVGAITRGAAIVEVMNAVGYDYMTLGNHEFDYGFARLMELLKSLKTKIISCNIFDIATQKNMFAPYVIKEIQGLKIGFVGITTPESLSKSNPASFQDEEGKYLMSFSEGGQGRELYEVVQKNVYALRAQGVDIVIALAHLGMDVESAPWNTPSLVAHTTGIDVVIDGHSHSFLQNMFLKNKDNTPVIITQTGSRLQGLGKLIIDVENKDIRAEVLQDVGGKDPEVQTLLDKMHAELAVILENTLGHAHVPLTTANAAGHTVIRYQETNLANLIADAIRYALDSDVSLINGGGIRASVDAGPISFREIIDVLPFGGDCLSLRVTGQTLLNALEMGVRVYPEPNGGFLHVSGLTYEIDTSIPSSVKLDEKGRFVAVEGPYRVKNVRVLGEFLDVEKKYSVAGTEFILRQGGDGMSMFKDAELLKDKFMVDNEALIHYIDKKLHGTVGIGYENPEGQGRISLFKN